MDMDNEKVASLPMYDCFVPDDSNHAIWEALIAGANGINDLPSQLDLFASCHSVWTAKDRLALTQTCGCPLVQEYFNYLTPIGTPIYAAPGCNGPTYKAAIVVSEKKFPLVASLGELLTTSSRLSIAANSFGSFSGWLMLLSSLSTAIKSVSATASELSEEALCSKIKQVVITGSHMGSLKAVRDGIIDIASIDCVSLQLAKVHCPALCDGLKVIGWSTPAPALPFATHKGASDEYVASLRLGLQNVVNSSKPDVVCARQHHLLIGVDTTGNINFATYQAAVTQHKNIISSVPMMNDLYSLPSLQPGKLPRDHFRVIVPTNSKNSAVDEKRENNIVTINPISKLQDATWPDADMKMLQCCKRFLAQCIFDAIYQTCCAVHSTVQEIIPATVIDTTLTTTHLCAAIDSITGKLLWPVQPDGGRPKIIFPSAEGVLLMIAHMELSPVSITNDDIGCTTVPQPPGVSDLHVSWITIQKCAIEVLHEQFPAVASKFSSDSKPDPMYYAGYMGAAAAGWSEYFSAGEDPFAEQKNATTFTKLSCSNSLDSSSGMDIDSAEAKSTGKNEDEETDRKMIKTVWQTDIALSVHLVNKARDTGIFAYISAPRHNDRGDWANLVIGQDEAAITNWRDSRGHSAARKYVAPYCYDHIRLHRGVFYGGLSSSQMHVARTVFLGATGNSSEATKTSMVPLAAPPVGSETSDANIPATEVEENLLKLRVVPDSSVPDTEVTSTDDTMSSVTTKSRGTTGRGEFEHYVVLWATVGTNPNSPVQLDTKVPGGAGITVGAFKTMLESQNEQFLYGYL